MTAPAVNLTVRRDRGERHYYFTPPSELVDENNRRKTEKKDSNLVAMNAERERRRSKIEIVVVGFVVFMICFEKWCPKKLP